MRDKQHGVILCFIHLFKADSDTFQFSVYNYSRTWKLTKWVYFHYKTAKQHWGLWATNVIGVCLNTV